MGDHLLGRIILYKECQDNSIFSTDTKNNKRYFQWTSSSKLNKIYSKVSIEFSMICCSLEIFQKNQQSVFKSTLGSKELIDSSRSSQKYLAKESHQISKNIEGMKISIPMGG